MHDKPRFASLILFNISPRPLELFFWSGAPRLVCITISLPVENLHGNNFPAEDAHAFLLRIRYKKRQLQFYALVEIVKPCSARDESLAVPADKSFRTFDKPLRRTRAFTLLDFSPSIV